MLGALAGAAFDGVILECLNVGCHVKASDSAPEGAILEVDNVGERVAGEM